MQNTSFATMRGAVSLDLVLRIMELSIFSCVSRVVSARSGRPGVEFDYGLGDTLPFLICIWLPRSVKSINVMWSYIRIHLSECGNNFVLELVIIFVAIFRYFYSIDAEISFSPPVVQDCHIVYLEFLQDTVFKALDGVIFYFQLILYQVLEEFF